MHDTNPPRWATSLLELLLTPANRATIVGDLLEDYRDAKVETMGRRAADWWYIRQVASFWWRSSAAWGVAFGIAATVRMLFDVFAPPSLHGWGPRSAVSTWTAISLLFGSGCYSAWKTGRVRSGALTAVAATVIGSIVVHVATALATGFTFDTHNPAGRSEDFVLIPFVLAAGIIIGSAGGTLGKLLQKISNQQSAIRNS